MSSRTAEHFAERNYRQFEEHVVKHLLSRYGLSAKWKSYLLDRHRAREQTTRLTLCYFQSLFPYFPIVLSVFVESKIDERNRTSTILSHFTKLPVVRAFRDSNSGLFGDPRPFGLVVKWPYLKLGGGAAVLHDMAADLARPGQRIVFSDDAGDRPLVLETLDSLLDAMDAKFPPARSDSWIAHPFQGDF